MPAPNDASIFSTDLHILVSETGTLKLSDRLVDLIVRAREMYAWPKKETTARSQNRIVELEQQVYLLIGNLNGENAQSIAQRVSEWGGNRAKARGAISNLSDTEKKQLAQSMNELLTPSSIGSGLRGLTSQPGVDLVMATKIYRFCAPQSGAAVDRHCSYFFNSLWVRDLPGGARACTQFHREFDDRTHKTTRLATFTKAGRERNLVQYLDVYLPLLAAMATSLNCKAGGFQCAASHKQSPWRPADVEMAAYQWWSRNGPR